MGIQRSCRGAIDLLSPGTSEMTTSSLSSRSLPTTFGGHRDQPVRHIEAATDRLGPLRPQDAAEAGPGPDWPQARWARILDRIEHRQANVGLRFWGPPLWLEVTMTGPDSDLWPANADDDRPWNWQSSTPCGEVADLASEGANDDRLLAAVARYTIENLILNAVHEIGEWLRFDGRRPFPAHTPTVGPPGESVDQGNGVVKLEVSFVRATDRFDASPLRPMPDELRGRRLVRRLGEVATAPRFTYLPVTTICYENAGPVIRRRAGGEAPAAWRSTWSSPTLDAAGGGGEDLLAMVTRDVHGALVSYEADRICRAFHVDGRRPWRLTGPPPPLGADPPDTGAPGSNPLSISITY